MGAVLSLGSLQALLSDYTQTYQNMSYKRQKALSSFENSRLIPSLPDEISIQILARLPRLSYFTLRSVSRQWKAALTTPEIFHLRKELKVTEQWLYLLTKNEDAELVWYALDPRSGAWQRLPPMLACGQEHGSGNTGTGIRVRITDAIRARLWKKDEAEQTPFHGCVAGVVDGILYVVGGFSNGLATNRMWKFDPRSNKWSEATPMSLSRAYCYTTVLNNKLYVIGGVIRFGRVVVPLQSAEVYDPSRSKWSDLAWMLSDNSEIPIPFESDALRPIAIGMVSYRERVYVPMCMYSWPFFGDAGGQIYDPDTDSWAKMPPGMALGWPSRHTENKLNVVVGGELYVFDLGECTRKGKIKVYDERDDSWKVVVGRVPVTDLSGSAYPFLFAELYGKLLFVMHGADHTVSVMQVGAASRGEMFMNGRSGLGACSHEDTGLVDDTESAVWRTVARKEFRFSEMVCCHIVDI